MAFSAVIVLHRGGPAAAAGAAPASAAAEITTAAINLDIFTTSQISPLYCFEASKGSSLGGLSGIPENYGHPKK